MAEKVVSVRLQARVEGFTAGMRKAKASVDDLTRADVPKAAKGYADLANKAALAGAAISVGLGVAVKRFADFDKAMSAVAANTGAAGEELEALRQSALKLGADSQFSATEAAQGVNELAKAGVAAGDILGGGLKGSLDLAAAGQIGVAEAAETTATALTQFKLSGDRAVDVADLLANGANKAQGGVSDLGAALRQAGLVAAATGLSVEETAAGLTAFASAGLIGSDAGTSFKTMLQRLTPQSDAAAAAMEQVGLDAFDAQGNFVGLATVAEQLQTGMGKLSQEQRAAAMTTIFGSDAVRASTILYEEGAEGIRKWTDEVSKQGAASDMAAKLTDNLTGDIERLGGAFDSALIQTGSGANNSLRTLVQGLTGLVDVVAKIPGPLLLAGGGLAALALTLPKGISVYRDFQASLKSVGASLDGIAAKGPRAAKGVEVAGKAAGAAGKAFIGLAAAAAAVELLGDDVSSAGVQQLTSDLLKAEDAVSAFSDSVKKNAADQGLIQGDLENFGNVLRATFDPDFLDSFNAKGDAVLSTISLGMIDLTTTTDDAAARLGDLDGVLAGLVSSGNGAGATDIFEQFAAAAEQQGVSVDQLKSKLPQYGEALAGVDNSATNAASATSVLQSATDDAATSAEDAKEAWDRLKEAINGLGSPIANQRAAERDFQAAVDAANASVKENGRTLDENTAKGRANQSALDAIAEATKDKVLADFEATGSTKSATAAMQAGRDEFIRAAVAAGKTKAEAKLLADQLGLIPKDVEILVSQSGADTASAAIDQAARDRTAYINVIERIGRRSGDGSYDSAPGRASGGAIFGPGTGTSDTAGLYRLSNGEHVLTAAEVAKLGGQSAVYSMRKAIMSGSFPGYARGGAVAVPNYAPPVQYVMGGSSSHRVTNDSSLNAQNVTIVTDDARSFQRELRRGTALRAKARPGR